MILCRIPSRRSCQRSKLKPISTCISHSSGSHSGTNTRLRLHQRFNSLEATSSAIVNPSRETSVSNSVTSGATNWTGLTPVWITFGCGGVKGLVIAADHTPSLGIAVTQDREVVDLMAQLFDVRSRSGVFGWSVFILASLSNSLSIFRCSWCGGRLVVAIVVFSHRDGCKKAQPCEVGPTR